MFSIEKTLNDIISFVKRFFLTFYTTLLHSRKILNCDIENLIRPSVFFIISLFLFLSLHASIGGKYEFLSSAELINTYTKQLSNNSVGDNLLFTIPISALVYFFIILYERLFLKNSADRLFRSYTFYWMGAAILLYLIYYFITVFIFDLLKQK